MKNIMMKIEEKINKNKVIYLVIIIMILLIIGTLLYKVNSNRLKANIIKAANESGFNDVNFYSCVIKNYNVLNNASLTPEDILSNEQLKTITSLSCDGSNTEDKIKNVNGLEKLVNLVQLNLNNNSIDDVVDLSNNTKLINVTLSKNNIASLNLGNNNIITTLIANDNYISNLNIENCTELENVILSNNSLTYLNLGNNLKLKKLYLDNNFIENIDLSNNALLEEFKIENNKLIKLDLRQNTKVNYFSSDLEINIVEGNSKLLSDILLLPNSSNLKIENENIATLNKQNDDYIINGIISGKTYLKVTNENDSSYQIEINVANDVKLISKKYNLNNICDSKNCYIYTGLDTDSETIKSNLDSNIGQIEVIDDMVYVTEYIENKRNILLERKIANFSINNFLYYSQEYLFLYNDYDTKSINCNNCSYVIENDDTISLYLGGKEIDYLYPIILKSKYDLTKKYIYIENKEFKLDIEGYVVETKDILKTNDFLEYNVIKIKDSVLNLDWVGHFEIPIISYTSDYETIKDNDKKIIVVDKNDLSLERFNVINATKEINNNKLYIKFNGEMLDEFDINFKNSIKTNDVSKNNEKTKTTFKNIITKNHSNETTTSSKESSKKTKDNDDTKEKQAGNTRVINNLKNDNMLVRKEKSIVNILVIILLVISFLMLSFSTYLVLKIRKTR